MDSFQKSYIRASGATDLLTLIADHLAAQPIKASMDPKELLEFGAVYLNGKRQRTNSDLRENDLIKVHLQPKRYFIKKLSFFPKVIYENTDFIVVDKPAPLPTHPTSDNFKENLLELMKEHIKTPLYVTSRLDVDTQGLLILAKSPQAQTEINQLFQQKQIKKWYTCLTKNRPPLTKLSHFQSPTKSPKRIFTKEPHSNEDKYCELIVQSIEQVHDQFISTIELLTGRTHQIRGQMALIGCPIIGDRIYGADLLESPPLGLVCSRLQWTWRDKVLDLSRPAFKL